MLGCGQRGRELTPGWVMMGGQPEALYSKVVRTGAPGGLVPWESEAHTNGSPLAVPANAPQQPDSAEIPGSITRVSPKAGAASHSRGW
jgi:hypothetical protein